MARARAKNVDSRFAIMLDEHLAENPDHWPIVRINDTLEEVRAHRQFVRIAWRVPRSSFEPQCVEPKALVHTPTNRRMPGAIYRIRQR
jgi:hypothetical protein